MVETQLILNSHVKGRVLDCMQMENGKANDVEKIVEQAIALNSCMFAAGNTLDC
jgi:hypothetical protein